jgi:GT2 family glycosyltransferase
VERPNLSILIPTYRRREMLRRCLEAFDAQVLPAGKRFEVVVVDDGSCDGTPELLGSLRPQGFELRWRAAERNAGQGAARTLGLGLSSGELVLFTGDDIVPDRHFVAEHLAAHREGPQVRLAILGKTVWPSDIPITTVMRHIDGVGAQQFSYHYLRDGSIVDYRHFYTSNISLPAWLLHEQPYLFDPAFTTYGYEDVELGYRLAQRGMRIRYTARALGFHYHPYTVYGFAERQYRSGLMACVIAAKQPATRRQVGIDDVEAAERKGQTAAVRAATAAWFEASGGLDVAESALLRLAAFYELLPVPPLDALYQGLFKYFYGKGIAGALREGTAREDLWRRLFVADVAPVADWFRREQARLGFRAPTDILAWIAARRFTPASAPRRPLWRRVARRVKRSLEFT